VVQAAKPEKIVLFGSVARGTPWQKAYDAP
jgi:hypothetical protein